MTPYFSQAGLYLIQVLFGFYILAVMLRLLFQLVRADFYNPFAQFLVTLTNPPLLPLRRIIPPAGGIDLASVVLLLGLQVLEVYLLTWLQGGRASIGGVLLLSAARLIELAVWVYIVAILIRVVLIHHPPVSEAQRHKQLLDAPVLLKLLARHGAELLLHGHDHLHMINWLEGPGGTKVPAIGVPSASAVPGSKEAAAYNLYRIDDAGGADGAWRCELISRGIAPGGAVAEQKRFMLIG